jgi:D-alanyl-D-alanine carboxypeptidase
MHAHFFKATLLALTLAPTLLACHAAVPAGAQINSAHRAAALDTPTPASPRTAADILAYLQAHPEQFSLASYAVEAPQAGIFCQADKLMPLASSAKLLVLYAYAARVASGEFKPEERLPLATLEMCWLVGTDGGAHAAAIKELRDHGAIAADETISLHDVAWAMMVHSDNACADYLIDRIGADNIQAVPAELGLPEQEGTLPYTGLYLSWGNPDQTDLPAQRLARYEAMPRDTYRALSVSLLKRFKQDADFHRRASAWWTSPQNTVTLADQAAFAQLCARGTARGYASLMAKIYQDNLPVAGAAPVMRELLEWPMKDAATAQKFDALGTKGGTMMGVLTGNWFSKLKAAPQAHVSSLFLDHLPGPIFMDLAASFAQQRFELKLLTDDAFFVQVRTALKGAAPAASP